MLLMVYELFETLEVTSELFTFTVLILYPLSGVKEMVADVPSFTVNELVLLRIVVPLNDAEPFPDAVIDKVYVIGGIASNSTSNVVLAEMLLIVYELFETLDVTSVLFTFTLLILYPLSGVKEMVADEPSFIVNELVLLRIVVPLYETEPLPVALMDNVKELTPSSVSSIDLKYLLQPDNCSYFAFVPLGTCKTL